MPTQIVIGMTPRGRDDLLEGLGVDLLERFHEASDEGPTEHDLTPSEHVPIQQGSSQSVSYLSYARR
jgi:hypothetical protein